MYCDPVSKKVKKKLRKKLWSKTSSNFSIQFFIAENTSGSVDVSEIINLIGGMEGNRHNPEVSPTLADSAGKSRALKSPEKL